MDAEVRQHAHEGRVAVEPVAAGDDRRRVPHVGLKTDQHGLGPGGLGHRERLAQPPNVRGGALGRLLDPRRLVGERRGPPEPVVVGAGHVQRHEDDLRLLPHHVLDELRVARMLPVEFLGLARHMLLVSAQRVTGIGEKQIAHARQLIERRTTGKLLFSLEIVE